MNKQKKLNEAHEISSKFNEKKYLALTQHDLANLYYKKYLISKDEKFLKLAHEKVKKSLINKIKCYSGAEHPEVFLSKCLKCEIEFKKGNQKGAIEEINEIYKNQKNFYDTMHHVEIENTGKKILELEKNIILNPN